MLPIRIKVQQKAFPSKRAYSRAMKAGHQEMGEHYHQQMIPKHFEPGAAQRYGMRPRSRGYKRRAKPQQPSYVERAIAKGQAVAAALTRPLTFSGDLGKIVEGLAVVRGYPTRATVTHNLPVYVPARPRTNKQPPVAAEATRVTKAEAAELSKVLGATVRQAWRRESAGENKTTNVG